MRYFTGLLFLGSGEYSERAAGLLHERLDEALSISGGLQQSSQGEPENEEATAAEEQERVDAVRDLAAAILGRDITIGDKLPYPPADGQRLLETYEAEVLGKDKRYFPVPFPASCTCLPHALRQVVRCPVHVIRYKPPVKVDDV